MAMLREFFRHVAPKKSNFFCRQIKTIERYESFTCYAVSALEFLFFFWRIVLFCQCGPESPQILETRKVESRLHFNRQIELNDEYLCKCQYFSCKKFLWMSLFQFLEMHTLSHFFICSGALVELLFWENHLLLTFGPIWVKNSPKILSFF